MQNADSAVGKNYMAVCEQANGEGAEDAAKVASGIRDILNGKCKSMLQTKNLGVSTLRIFCIINDHAGSAGVSDTPSIEELFLKHGFKADIVKPSDGSSIGALAKERYKRTTM